MFARRPATASALCGRIASVMESRLPPSPRPWRASRRVPSASGGRAPPSSIC